ncbi:MAG: helix-turn-helix transcriptional regulator [Bacillota bacterium]|jgi:DNA-binding CsgD family transcriptional regulator|nr:helix-turn-helix transcriptional regulator [Bacillota bacterium]HOC06494.1 helix-turn-helix transcriptional regulator [Bacillota bacterium]HQD19826.1 helix-turn-helix transcriptional regulator [Bacillota bacterium]
MGTSFLLRKLRQYKEGIDSVGNYGLPMRVRLFIFFLAFLLLIMAGVLAILFASGIFKSSYNESYKFMERELTSIADHIHQDFNTVTVHSLELARRLTLNLEREFLELKISPDNLQEHPELLEGILGRQMSLLASSLEQARSSGVILILDATVNPGLPGAEHSKAGLFIKNMEPNIVSASFSNLRFLRGPTSVARNHKMELLPQWRMEFSVKDMECFYLVLDTAKDSELPLSRLYYWSHGMRMHEDCDTAMYCLVPLKDSRGQVFGVCGFEISSMLFKLSYSPQYMAYHNIFGIFSPVIDGQMHVEGSLLSGSYRPVSFTSAPLTVAPQKDFTHFKQEAGGSFAGLDTTISLYPNDSAYQEQWRLALLIEQEELARILTGQNKQLSFLLLLLVAVSVVVSAIVSWGYTRPVSKALKAVKSRDIAELPKTRIPEIDDLISFLAEQDEASGIPSAKESTLLQQFIKNIESLSAAERAVFNLYLEGYTAQEIANILCLSINTIKTHNKRIYMKLNVSSRKELMLYIQMMEEAEQEAGKKQ